MQAHFLIALNGSVSFLEVLKFNRLLRARGGIYEGEGSWQVPVGASMTSSAR